MSPVGAFYRLSHPDVLEETLLTEPEYDDLVGGDRDWPAGSAIVQVTLVTLDEFLAAVRAVEP